MSNVPSIPPPGPDRDAAIVAQVVALVHARRKHNYLAAADAHRALERLGVRIKFTRDKGVKQ